MKRKPPSLRVRAALVAAASASLASAWVGGACGTSSASASPTPAPTATLPIPPNTVAIREYSWSPNPLVVSAGTLVTWRNDGQLAHRVTTGTACTPAPSPVVASPSIPPGSTWSFTFGTTGTYVYTDPGCCPMGDGTVIVQ